MVEPYPYPISYRGRYYFRSGSTNQKFKGPALDTFLLQKQGKRWDGVPVPEVRASELDGGALDLFRERAVRSYCVAANVRDETVETT